MSPAAIPYYLQSHPLLRLERCSALAFRLWLRLEGYSPIAVYVLPFCRMDGLAIGGLVAALARGLPQGVAGLVSTARPVAAMMGVIVLAMVATGDNYDWKAFATQTVGYSALAIFFAAILVEAAAATPQTSLGRWLSSSWMRAFGKYSYGIYLFHLPIRAFVRDVMYTPTQFATLFGSPLPGQVLFYGIAGGLAFVAAWLSWHLYESHWLALKKYVAYAVPRSRITSPTPVQ